MSGLGNRAVHYSPSRTPRDSKANFKRQAQTYDVTKQCYQWKIVRLQCPAICGDLLLRTSQSPSVRVGQKIAPVQCGYSYDYPTL
jgi:hypothetical protein